MALTRRLRESIAQRARALPLARHAWARYRRHRYERRIERFVTEKSGRADRLPLGAVYEATMRCNLHCEFCYVGDLLNLEGEWRQELTLASLEKAFPEREGFQISLTGGEIFMRKDILSVLDLFRQKMNARTNQSVCTLLIPAEVISRSSPPMPKEKSIDAAIKPSTNLGKRSHSSLNDGFVPSMPSGAFWVYVQYTLIANAARPSKTF